MAIQHRRGTFDKFDPTQLLPGEWAIVMSGDTNATDGKAVYMCFAAGSVKRLATFEDMAEAIANATDSIVRELTGDIGEAVEKANSAAEKCESGEGERVAAEETRVENENARSSSEQTRVSSEEARESAETGRVEAEKTRVEAEKVRETAEAARSDAESGRSTAEEARTSAESDRASSEEARADAEASRAEAESGRVASEATRESAEGSRESAESSRVAAEAQRVAEFAEMKQRSRGWLYAYCEQPDEYDPETRKPIVDEPDTGTLYFTPVEEPTDTNRWLEWSWDAPHGRWELQGLAELDLAATSLSTDQIRGLFEDNPPQGTEVLTGAGLSYLWAMLGTATVGQVLGGEA